MIVKFISSIKCRIWDKLYQKFILKSIAEHGDDIVIGERFSACLLERIYMGSHIYIGDGACFLCAEADIRIGNYVMFGPEVMIITGNHRTNVVGEYMYNVRNKLPQNDEPVVIDDDVWIGARAIILKGTHIHSGSVIAAGAIVSGNVPPCSIYFSKEKIRPRFSENDTARHIRMMNYEGIY